MWIELKNLEKKYYEGDKKYINKIFRNNKAKCELNIVSVYEEKRSSHMITIYSLEDAPIIIKNLGPTKIQFFVENEKLANEITSYIKNSINNDKADFNKIYNNKYTNFVIE
jgi:hypothetical protein